MGLYRGKNTNSVSLICNYSDEEGWYEFNITNGGKYTLSAYFEQDGEYKFLADGGSVEVINLSCISTAFWKKNSLIGNII